MCLCIYICIYNAYLCEAVYVYICTYMNILTIQIIHISCICSIHIYRQLSLQSLFVLVGPTPPLHLLRDWLTGHWNPGGLWGSSVSGGTFEPSKRAGGQSQAYNKDSCWDRRSIAVTTYGKACWEKSRVPPSHRGSL